MTREDARKLLSNLEVVKHFANGGEIVFPFYNCHGEFIREAKADSMLLNCSDRYKIAPEKTLCPTCGQEVKEE